VRKNILERYPDAPLRVYTVWVPQLGATRGDIDPELFGDDRVTTYWDPDELVTQALELYAWDVYALYDRDARWEGGPPELVGSGYPVIGASDQLKRELAGVGVP
jgi:hypothetical protein